MDIDQDYEQILNCVERHTVCKEGACLRKKRGRMVCRLINLKKKLISKLFISPFSTSSNDKICIHQCFRYNAPWQLNLEGSKLYTDAESGEKKFEPARNDD